MMNIWLPQETCDESRSTMARTKEEHYEMKNKKRVRDWEMQKEESFGAVG